MSTPRVTVDDALSVSRVTVTDTAPRVTVEETAQVSGIAVTATGQNISVVLSPTAAGVSSVNGVTGAVTGIATEAYVQNQIATKDNTDEITEGTVNKYFTQARARTSISASGSLSYDSATGVVSYTTPSTDGIAEGTTNKYYTDGRADARVALGIAAIDYPVDSVNGKTNTVVLTTTDIAEGTRQYYTDARVGTYLTANNYATQSYVGTQIANLVDSAPGTLDTLNELAAALGDDPNFATTITAALGNKLNTADFASTANTWLGTKTTSNLAEGTNLYFTDQRARDAVGGSSITINPGRWNSPYTENSAIRGFAQWAASGTSNFTVFNTSGLNDNTPFTISGFASHTQPLQKWNVVGSTVASMSTSGVLTAASLNLTTYPTTTNIGEGTRLYYTDARARGAISVSGSLSYDSATGVISYTTPSTSGITEGTNLYYTDDRVTTRINNTSINALSDVSTATAAAGQMIYFDGTNWVNSANINSANINRFLRTNDGTASNAILAVSRNRADAARATDQGPWLGFEYVGTDNTQATAPQSAIRSMYDSGGNHKLQVVQLPGNYTTPTLVAQFQRGNHLFNNTSGGQHLILTDTAATIRGSTTTITNNPNTTTYAQFAASGHTIGNVDAPITAVRNSGANTGIRPVQFVRNIVTATTTPASNDGASYRLQVAGSNLTPYNLANITASYNSGGDHSLTFDLANGDQNGSTMSSLSTISSKITETRIRAGTASATPGGSSVNDIMVVDNNRILNNRPHRSAVTTASIARGSTYTPAATVNNFIELTLTAGTDPTYIDVDNITVAGEGGHQAILVYNNSGSAVGNGDLIVRNNGVTINNFQDSIANGSRVIFTIYCIGNYASCEYMTAA
jgi:hypothetical protein